MEIKAKCKFDYQSVKDTYFMMVCGKKNPKKCFLGLIIFIAIASALLAGLMVLNWMLDEGISVDSIEGLLWSAFIILFFCFAYFIAPKLQFKMLKNMQNMANCLLNP